MAGPGPTRDQPAHASWRVRQVAAWRRPRLVAPGDPDRDQTLAALRQAISDLPQGTVVLAQDETHINLLPWVRATWIARGRRTQVITPGKNHRRTVFGAVQLATGRWCYQICRKAVSATFTAICEQLLATWPTAPLVAVVCDNTIIHRSKIVQRWLAAHPRILARRPLQPPGQPCRAHLGALKAWLANTPTLTIQGRVRQVHAFFRARSPTQILTTAAPHSSPWLPEGLHAELQAGRLGVCQPRQQAALRPAAANGLGAQSRSVEHRQADDAVARGAAIAKCRYRRRDSDSLR